MKLKLLVLAAAVCVPMFANAAAPSPWFQTAILHDKDLITNEPGIQREYIVPNSILHLGSGKIGRVYGVTVKDTFTPPPAGTNISYVLSSVAINCENLTWGEYDAVSFKTNGEPSFDGGKELDKSGPIWLPKDMGMPSGASFDTMMYICNGHF